MFSLKIFNEKEVLMCLEKAGKRKGKQVKLGDVPSGSFVRWNNELLDFNIDNDHLDSFSVFSVYSILDGMRIGTGGSLKANADKIVTLVMDAKEVVRPKEESPIKTKATMTRDGLVHCQNYVFGNRGQHFVVSKDEFESRIKIDGREITSVEAGNCDCGLSLGECREYDGRTWKRKD